MKTINDIIEDIIKVEGGYMDSDVPTRYGITQAVARRHGYDGDMQNLPIDLARGIYYQDYVVTPCFDRVYLLSPVVAAELVDTGVNMGTSIAATFLQQCLNAFNLNQKLYRDVKIDGQVGNSTITALQSFLRERKEKGQDVLLKALNCLQGARYLSLADQNQKLENYVFGWIDNRIKL